MQDQKKTEGRKLSFGATMKSVFWSFFGVRKKSAYERDAEHLNPFYVIAAVIVGAAIFIGVLVALVKIAVAT
jgi:hypothetical protein